MNQIAERRRDRRYPYANLAGVRVDAVDGRGAKELLKPLLKEPDCQHVVTAHADYLRQAASDAGLREIINSAALVVPDGMPVVWAARVSGAPASKRVTGHDLVQALTDLSASDGASLFLLGAAAGVAELAAQKMKQRHPGVRIAGVYSPPICSYPFPEEEDRRIVETINASGADALLVAFGCPKQDLWIAAHRDDLNVSVAMGVGCVLDVIAGAVGRAPGWLQVVGLEWLYRLIQEPRRLWWRYLGDAAFLFLLICRTARLRLVKSGIDR